MPRVTEQLPLAVGRGDKAKKEHLSLLLGSLRSAHAVSYRITCLSFSRKRPIHSVMCDSFPALTVSWPSFFLLIKSPSKIVFIIKSFTKKISSRSLEQRRGIPIENINHSYETLRIKT